jgi:DNA-binding MurR/RpiR family transcriptional regulator
MTAGNTIPADVAFVHSALGKVLAGVRAEGSASHRSIADYLMRNPMRGTALKIEEMAEGCQVSTATISRFARDIGFNSYGAMRSALAETLHTAMQPVEKLRTSIARRKVSQSPGEASMEYARSNLAATQGRIRRRCWMRWRARSAARAPCMCWGWACRPALPPC